MTGTISVCLILLVFGFCRHNICLSQQGEKSNLEILEQDISAELEKFYYLPDINRSLQFVFFVESSVKDKHERKFTESLVKKTAERNKLRFSFSKDETMYSADSIYYKAKVTVNRLKTSYTGFGKNRFLGDKTLKREIVSELGIEIRLNDGTSLVADNIKTTYKGEIPYDGYEQYETEEYLFTRSVPPDISLLESIIFPAALVVVSVIATVLFFTIRSK